MPNYKIYIDGAAGTTGLQIHSRLASMPDIEVLTLPDDLRKNLAHRLSAMQSANLSILCLPDDAAKELVSAAPENIKVIDASTAHRTLPNWTYGFPELGGRRKIIRNASRVAVPGCHASGFLVLISPLVETGVLSPAKPVYCHSISGYSGAGKAAIAVYEDANRPKNYSAPRMYSLGMNHKHLPEMKAISGLKHAPMFCPVICDFYNGMLVSVPLDASLVSKQWRSPGKLAALYQDYYQSEPLITVKALPAVPEDGMLSAMEMANRDDMEIFVLGNEKKILLCARFDNLGKGAAGAAVQCANLMLGRNELEGLRLEN